MEKERVEKIVLNHHVALEKTCCSVMVKCVDYHWLIGHLTNSESLQLVFY